MFRQKSVWNRPYLYMYKTVGLCLNKCVCVAWMRVIDVVWKSRFPKINPPFYTHAYYFVHFCMESIWLVALCLCVYFDFQFLSLISLVTLHKCICIFICQIFIQTCICLFQSMLIIQITYNLVFACVERRE